MSGDALELEARLKDYISGNMTSITDALEKYGKKFEEAGSRQKKSEDLMSRSMRDLGSSWDVAKIAMTSMVSAMGAMEIFNRVTGFIKMGREEAKEYIEVSARMKSSLGFVSTELNQQAAILGKKLVVDDEEIKKIQTQISYFTKNEEQIKRLTKASLDFAAATGGSATSVARAIEYNSRELARYGIRITSAEGSLERIDEIIAKVNKRFGGQAEAVAESKDWIDKLGVSIMQLGENFGLLIRGKAIDDMDAFHKRVVEGSKDAAEAYKYSAEQVRQSTEYINKQMEERRKASYENVTATNAREAGVRMQKMEELQFRIWNQTEQGRIKILQTRRDHELFLAKDDAIQKKLIWEYYAKEIAKIQEEITKKEKEEAEKRAKELERYLATMLPNRETFEKGTESEAEKKKKAQEEDDKRQEQGYKAELMRVNKLVDKDNEEAREKKKNDDDVRDRKIKNAQYVSDSAFQTLDMIASASKAGAAIQKTLDIAQASANTAIAVTKSLATPWMIPFIVTMGAAQVALIASQKYSGGGIVSGGSPAQGDVVPAMLTPGEMVLNGRQQSELFNLLQPSTISNISNKTVSNHQAINVNINVGAGGNYDMGAARMTIDSLVPVIGDALVRAKNEGRLRDYEAAR